MPSLKNKQTKKPLYIGSSMTPTLLSNIMVQALNLGVVSQQVQALPVRLPQELHPRGEQQAISTILSVLTTHSTQEHTEITKSSKSVIHLKFFKHLLIALYLQLCH